MHFCRRGIMTRETGLSSMLMMIIPLENEELRMTCRSLSMYTIGDLVDLKRAGASWYTPGPLASLAAYLPEIVPVQQQPLRVGQYWKLAYRYGQMKTDDVIRVDGGAENSVVVAWYRVVLGAVPSLVRYSGERFTVPVAEIFANMSHVRCDIQCTQGANYRLTDCRLQPSPRWTTLPEPALPLWVCWFQQQLL